MKRLISAFVSLLLALAMPALAFADHIDGNSGWYVEYTTNGVVDDNYTQKSWADNVSQLQPGDDISLAVEVRHSNDNTADWYLSNEVLKSLEEGDAKGSAYGYKLSYVGPTNSRTLFESKSVGGIGSDEGLAEATNAMDDYFFLGTLSKGEKGKVVLDVSLDGETEGNAYFDTLAQLKLKFAVEPNVVPQSTPSSSTNTNNKVVHEDKEIVENRTVDKTETVERPVNTQSTRVVTEDKVVDEVVVVNKENVVTDSNVVNRYISANRAGLAKTGDQTTLFPVYLAIAGLGIVCLALAIRNVRKKDDENKGGAQ